MAKQVICIDYDDTYTADPDMWNRIIPIMKQHGFRVICATMRFPEEGADVGRSIGQWVDQIIFTKRQAKKTYLMGKKIHVDIWIDDRPEWLFADSF
jgi:hypothetical protein